MINTEIFDLLNTVCEDQFATVFFILNEAGKDVIAITPLDFSDRDICLNMIDNIINLTGYKFFTITPEGQKWVDDNQELIDNGSIDIIAKEIAI